MCIEYKPNGRVQTHRAEAPRFALGLHLGFFTLFFFCMASLLKNSGKKYDVGLLEILKYKFLAAILTLPFLYLYLEAIRNFSTIS